MQGCADDVRIRENDDMLAYNAMKDQETQTKLCLYALWREIIQMRIGILEFKTTLTISSFAAWPAVGWMGSSTFRSQVTQSSVWKIFRAQMYCNDH